MKSDKIIVKTNNGSYPVYFGSKIIKLTGSVIKKRIPGAKKIFIAKCM